MRTDKQLFSRFVRLVALVAAWPGVFGGVLRAAEPLAEATVRVRADALLAQMTPAEKAGQLVMGYCFVSNGTVPPRLGETLATGGIGALNFVATPEQSNALQRHIVENSRLKIPVLISFNVIHGFRTIFPVPIGMAATWDPALVERSEGIAAAEARAAGIHWALAPVLDVARDPRWGRIVEGPGEDPYLASAMAVAHVRGLQGPAIGSPGGLIAGPKHFAAYGAPIGGRDYDQVDLSESDLWNVYLPPFAAAVKAGAGNIMSAYMSLNGVPATGNAWLLTDVLRNTWGFKGFVVSDANAVKDLQTQGFAKDRADAAARGLSAGTDLELALGANVYADVPALLTAGRIDEKTVDQSVRRILEMKIRMGLFEHPYVDEAQAKTIIEEPAHRDMARVAAERAAVLLRNEGGLLPLSAKTLKSLAVIGPLADAPRDILGPWVFVPKREETVSILSGIRAKLGSSVRVDFAWGPAIPARKFPSQFGSVSGESDKPPHPLDPEVALAQAVETARNADAVVLVLGEAQDMIGEGASRSTLELPGRQQELLEAVVATGKPVVLVLMCGRPLDIRVAAEKVPSILQVWYPGTQGGAAVANLLFGDAVPGGKLPFTWVRHVGQVPMIYSRLPSHMPSSDGQRYWNEASTPLYPFGHGLSYSSFEFANLRVDRPEAKVGEAIKISVDVTNKGSRRADEVAQLYVHQRSGSAARPVRELKGFLRLTLDPGESRAVTFTLGPDELRYWSTASRGWVLEAAGFDVWVGSDSTAKLATSFDLVASEGK